MTRIFVEKSYCGIVLHQAPKYEGVNGLILEPVLQCRPIRSSLGRNAI